MVEAGFLIWATARSTLNEYGSCISSHNQVCGHRAEAAVTLEWKNTQGKKKNQTKRGMIYTCMICIAEASRTSVTKNEIK